MPLIQLRWIKLATRNSKQFRPKAFLATQTVSTSKKMSTVVFDDIFDHFFFRPSQILSLIRAIPDSTKDISKVPCDVKETQSHFIITADIPGNVISTKFDHPKG
jgi:HSP20 family molecular chaperone IbpA